MKSVRWIKFAFSLIIIALAIILIVTPINSTDTTTSTGAVITKIPSGECRVGGLSGQLVISQEHITFASTYSDPVKSKDKATAWQNNNIAECEKRVREFNDLCGDVVGECRRVGDGCEIKDNRNNYNCANLPQTCVYRQETQGGVEYDIYDCELSNIEFNLGICTCEKTA